MQIYLAKPGGQKEGPYTLEQINRDLADRKYTDDDYWAWHEGLPNWLPLHAIPGVSSKAGATVPALPPPVTTTTPVKPVHVEVAKAITPAPAPVKAEPEKPSILVKAVSPEITSKPATSQPVAAVAVPEQPEAPVKRVAEAPAKPERAAEAAAAPAPEESAAAAEQKVPSGLPFGALEQIFVFTTGEGRAVFDSPAVAQRLQMSVGEPVSAIRGKVQVDVIGHVDLGVDVIHEDFIPEKAWRAMSIIKPAVTQQARNGAHHVCVRPLLAENNDIVTLFLLYNKQKV